MASDSNDDILPASCFPAEDNNFKSLCVLEENHPPQVIAQKGNRLPSESSRIFVPPSSDSEPALVTNAFLRLSIYLFLRPTQTKFLLRLTSVNFLFIYYRCPVT